ncbi:MAG: succinylglutamate desuccinylase/aspartoacylase family protein [Gemmatimonadota bacterium]
MSGSTSGAVAESDRVGIEVERILGRVRGERPGPSLVAVGGLHGNEPAGVLALQRVVATLVGRQDRLRGELVAIAGNRRALRVGRRFLVRDLNRAWGSKRVEMLRTTSSALEGGEDQEQSELLKELDEAFHDARGPVFVVDLHTTSGEGAPFSTACDTLRNRAFALTLPIPLVLGLEERVEGTLMDWVDGLGHTVMVVETGQNQDPLAVERAEGAIWLALVAAGLLDAADAPEAEAAKARLEDERGEIPRVLEFRYRHPVAPSDQFTMLPGFRSFQPVDRGQVLAHDVGGEVRSPATARILMPLYQAQGDDGFFIVREFRFIWLKISEWLRHLHTDRVVHWLPGIHRVAGYDDRLLVNRRVARWYALELLHLLGYRREREQGAALLVQRRPSE